MHRDKSGPIHLKKKKKVEKVAELKFADSDGKCTFAQKSFLESNFFFFFYFFFLVLAPFGNKTNRQFPEVGRYLEDLTFFQWSTKEAAYVFWWM